MIESRIIKVTADEVKSAILAFLNTKGKAVPHTAIVRTVSQGKIPDFEVETPVKERESA